MKVLQFLSIPTVLAVVALGAVTAPVSSALDSPAIDLLPDETHQEIEGFGYSTAFQRPAWIHNLPEQTREEVVNLLLDPEVGAAPSILRLGIGGSPTATGDKMISIQPADPGGTGAEPQYIWDGWDSGQVWFAKEAQKRGVSNFYADAWTAPGYMKTNGTYNQGGTLCGLQGTTCDSGDWRTAYANYLVQYAKFYAQEGIDIATIGFTNEPDYTTSYESMRFTPEQAAEFVAHFGPYAEKAGIEVACCDSFGWPAGEQYLDAIESNPAALEHLDVYTAHSYAGRSNFDPQAPVRSWMSEWAPSSVKDGWNEAWDSGKVTDGIQIAEHIHDTLAQANASAYLYWLGASRGGTAALMQINDTAGTYRVSSRFYAYSAFSRFVRPGAERIGVDHQLANAKISAYRNADGTQVVEIINTGTEALNTDIDLKLPVTAYLTDSAHNLEASNDIATAASDRTSLKLPARSLVTLVTGPDQTSPAITITNPRPGTHVDGPLTVSGTASDEQAGIEKVTVELRLPGQPGTVALTADAVVSKEQWETQLDTSVLQPGPYQLFFSGRDRAGNSTTSHAPVPVIVR